MHSRIIFITVSVQIGENSIQSSAEVYIRITQKLRSKLSNRNDGKASLHPKFLRLKKNFYLVIFSRRDE